MMLYTVFVNDAVTPCYCSMLGAASRVLSFKTCGQWMLLGVQITRHYLTIYIYCTEVVTKRTRKKWKRNCIHIPLYADAWITWVPLLSSSKGTKSGYSKVSSTSHCSHFAHLSSFLRRWPVAVVVNLSCLQVHFNTGPESTSTHWKQTQFLLKTPVPLQKGRILLFLPPSPFLPLSLSISTYSGTFLGSANFKDRPIHFQRKTQFLEGNKID